MSPGVVETDFLMGGFFIRITTAALDALTIRQAIE
jgi:hypothetical protein